MSRPGYLYRAFDSDGVLLYVGASMQPGPTCECETLGLLPLAEGGAAA